MKLYDGARAPNPRRVRIFLAEKGIAVPTEAINLAAMEHKTAAYTAINPLQQVPALVLDDGTVITESIAICRYFEALHPQPALFGTGALEQARLAMWNRRLENNLFFPIAQAFRHLHLAMKAMEVTQIVEWGEINKVRTADFLPLLDRALASSPFIAGDSYSIADITGLVAIDFMKPARLAVPPELVHIARWHAEVADRPSAKA
jgi:glutathione S-transferase